MEEKWFCFRNTFFLQTKYNCGESESHCCIVDVVCYRTVANTRLPLFLSDTFSTSKAWAAVICVVMWCLSPNRTVYEGCYIRACWSVKNGAIIKNNESLLLLLCRSKRFPVIKTSLRIWTISLKTPRNWCECILFTWVSLLFLWYLSCSLFLLWLIDFFLDWKGSLF